MKDEVDVDPQSNCAKEVCAGLSVALSPPQLMRVPLPASHNYGPRLGHYGIDGPRLHQPSPMRESDISAFTWHSLTAVS